MDIHIPVNISEGAFQNERNNQRAELDQLFRNVRAFRSTNEAKELFDFTVRFRFLSPFNAMLVRAQRPGCRFVATAYDWKKKYARSIKLTATPLVVLWTFGPVNFMFDISDTEEIPDKEGEPIPDLAKDPFKCEGADPSAVFNALLDNMPGQGIIVYQQKLGAHGAGSIGPIHRRYFQFASSGKNALPLPVRALYGLKLAAAVDLPTTFATTVHELGHLFCGHLSPWIRDDKVSTRGDLSDKTSDEKSRILEFEAESVSWLVCKRLGISVPSDSYLDNFLAKEKELPDVNLDLIFKAVGKIESLYKRKHAPRKDLVLKPDSTAAREYTLWKDEMGVK